MIWIAAALGIARGSAPFSERRRAGR